MPAKKLSSEQLADAKRLSMLFEKRQEADRSLTQEHLAYLCGWKTQGAVHQYLNGKIPLNLKALLKFCKALQVLPEQISPSLASQMADVPGQNIEVAFPNNELSHRLDWAVKNKEERNGTKVTGAAIAAACGVSTAAVSRWRNGPNGIEGDYARPLAEFLGVDPIWLETGKGSPEHKKFDNKKHTKSKDDKNAVEKIAYLVQMYATLPEEAQDDMIRFAEANIETYVKIKTDEKKQA